MTLSPKPGFGDYCMSERRRTKRGLEYDGNHTGLFNTFVFVDIYEGGARINPARSMWLKIILQRRKKKEIKVSFVEMSKRLDSC